MQNIDMDIKTFLFPVSLDPAQDIEISQTDAKTAKVLYEKIFAIASTLLVRRNAIIAASTTEKVGGKNRGSSWSIGWEDLETREPIYLKGRRFSDILHARCSALTVSERGKLTKAITVPLCYINTHIILPKTDKRFGLRLYKNKIEVTERVALHKDIKTNPKCSNRYRDNIRLPSDFSKTPSYNNL